MTKKIMTVRSAGNIVPPPTSASQIAGVEMLGERSARKIWKKLIVRFKRVPTKAELKAKNAILENYYNKAAKIYEARLRKNANDPTIKIVVVIPAWQQINPQKYYVVIIMIRKGPGDVAVNPPKVPGPPKGSL